jgi:hypothetical protein
MNVWREVKASPSKVEPTLANAKKVTAANESWTLGNAIKIMDANTSDGDFIVTHIFIEYCDVWDFYYEGEF